MALEGFVAPDFAATCHPEPFHRCSFAFDLRHVDLLFVFYSRFCHFEPFVSSFAPLGLSLSQAESTLAGS